MRIQLGGGRKRGEGKPVTIVGKLFTTLFLSVFVAAGVFFGTMMYGEVQQGIDQQGWVERPCTVTDSDVDIDSASNEPYTPRVEYTYTHGGRSYRGSSLDHSDPATSNYTEAQGVVLGYPAGSTRWVFVNPDAPSESLIETKGAESLLFVLFAVVFLSLFSGIPLLIIASMWWPGRGGDSERQTKLKAARARGGKSGRGGMIAGLLFGGVFAAAGLGMLIFMSILPLYRAAGAQGWLATACEIERSEVLRFEGDDGPTYRIDVLYFYEVNGERYGSNRHDFASFGSSSGQDGKRAVTRRYPIGSQAMCYVDPNDPTSAVLERGLTLTNLWGLFPLPFLLAGLAIMYFSAFGGSAGTSNRWRPGKGKGKREGKTVLVGADGFVPHHDDGTATGPVVLQPRGSRVGGFVGMTLMALFWNGIVGVFLYHLSGGWIKGEPDICPSLFMVPFVLVGLFLIGASVNRLMLIFAPSVVIELGRRTMPLGGSTALRWHVEGGTGRVESVTIRLIGEERATYTRGTDTITDTHTFFEQVLVGGEGGDDAGTAALGPLIDRGEVVLSIPLDTMHSFEASNNKIVWKLRVRAQVARWPDPKDDYDLTVLPMPLAPGGRGSEV